jgi:hypothetical protein
MAAPLMPLHALKRSPKFDALLKTFEDVTDQDAFKGIRCPICAWKPDAFSLWSCSCQDTPEPPFPSCGTVWNTFRTAGRCPGCSHQWKWTSCLSCQGWSPHVEWYEDKRPHP